jgi:uncharacterized protein YxjI
MLSYPLQLNFKKLALAHQLSVSDADGNLVWYVKQKAFKLKEKVTVCADREQTRPLFEIEADRVLDFSARYSIRSVTNATMSLDIGHIQRRGMRSLWKSSYEIERGGTALYNVQEENPWAKVADALMCEIPLLGLLSGYVFHPRYLVTRAGGDNEILRIEKQPAFLEGKFEIERLGQIDERDEPLILLSVMMIVLLERSRG